MKHFRENKKHHILPLVLIAVLLLSVSVGVAWAVSYLVTDEVENTFEPAQTSIEVKETFDGTTKSNVYVANTGSTSDPKGPAVYVRVKLLAYWYAKDSNHIVAKTSWTPSFTLGTDWVNIDGYYYYKKPIEAGQNTSNLISSITLSTDSEGNRQVLEILAEAVQSNPKNAVMESWGVGIDSNGYITTP